MLHTILLPANTAEAVTDAVSEIDVNILELLMEGGWYIMLPLALMSIFAMYVYFERYMAIRRAQRTSPDFMQRLKDYISQGQIPSAKNLCADNDTPMARMLEKGISRIGKPLSDISTAIENVGKLEIYILEKNMNILGYSSGSCSYGRNAWDCYRYGKRFSRYGSCRHSSGFRYFFRNKASHGHYYSRTYRREFWHIWPIIIWWEKCRRWCIKWKLLRLNLLIFLRSQQNAKAQR